MSSAGTSRAVFPPQPSPAGARRLRRDLRAWYRARRRALPWRRDRDPYRVWISEAMLQQTRVETVIGYYERFLARFPDVRALAAASEADVLAAWSGLGYYRRARALRAAARALVERHGGHFPRRREELLLLPGVGPYTAGAVLSIAFDAPEPLVDGNVARVFCRLFGLDADADDPRLQRELWSRALSLVPRRGAGDWNQALMELGATVCTPREPACGACPLAARCAARAAGSVARLPRPKARRAAQPVELEILLVERAGRWLLERRPPGGRMAGLWQLPTIERPGERPGERRGARARHARLFPARWPAGPRLCAGAVLGELRHAITHHRIRAVVRAGRIAGGGRVADPLGWFGGCALGDLPLTGMTRKIVRRWGAALAAAGSAPGA